MTCISRLVQLSGIALIALGACLWNDVPRVLLSRLFAPSTSHPLFYYVSLGLIAAGLLICALGVLGCWAACLHSRSLLGVVCHLSPSYIILTDMACSGAVCVASATSRLAIVRNNQVHISWSRQSQNLECLHIKLFVFLLVPALSYVKC